MTLKFSTVLSPCGNLQHKMIHILKKWHTLFKCLCSLGSLALSPKQPFPERVVSNSVISRVFHWGRVWGGGGERFLGISPKSPNFGASRRNWRGRHLNPRYLEGYHWSPTQRWLHYVVTNSALLSVDFAVLRARPQAHGNAVVSGPGWAR